MSLKDRVPADYTRPRCSQCHRTMAFIHMRPGGSRYGCLPCEFGLAMRRDASTERISTSEASWIIRHGITTPESRKQDRGGGG